MKFKLILNASMGVLLSCTTVFVSSAQAEDYITKSQVNVANGVAGLNASKQVTADVNNNEQFNNRFILREQHLQKDDASDPSSTNFLRFLTGTTSPMVDLFYNREARKDPWGNQLDANTFYFSNHGGGNQFQFVGNVAATGNVSANTISANTISAKSIKNGYELDNPYRHTDQDSIIRLTDDQYNNDVYVRRNTLMIGGKSRASYAGIKATCQNTSSGDLGGSCYQFTDMAGEHGLHRGGAGFTDGINMDIRSTDNSPVDVIGGNTLIANSDGTYTVKGNDYQVAENVDVGVNTFKIKGAFGCGLAGLVGSNKTGCKMTGINVVDGNGVPVTNPVTVTPGEYNSEENTTLVQLPDSYKTGEALTPSIAATITFYSADGVAYAVKNVKDGAEIYPALSEGEQNLIHPRMAIWSNIADGMFDTEGRDIRGLSNIDMPNYYYSYESGVDSKSNYTKIALETAAYPGNGGNAGWRKLSLNPGELTAVTFAPGDANNTNDTYDYKVTYIHPKTKEVTYNHNFHQYSQPTLFLGLNQKNFNIYTLQSYDRAKDSITREFDNEWDFWIRSTRDYSVNTRGLTLTWGMADPQYQHRFAYGSHMAHFAGGGFMPQGVIIDGVWDDGGKIIDTDAGFSILKQTKPTSDLDVVGGSRTASTLGVVNTKQGAYQLISYMSNDGDTNNNNSLHLGLTKKTGGVSYFLATNYSPTCDGDASCSALGQLVFDPLGHNGGIALGSGQGKNTKIGLAVDKDGYIYANNSLFIDNGKLLTFKSDTNPNAVYFYTKYSYTDADKEKGIADTRGDLYVGTQVAGGANMRGVNGYFGQSFTAQKQVTSPKFVGTLSTPSSSTAACTVGEFKDDINYHYVCVYNNKWKRVALSDF